MSHSLINRSPDLQRLVNDGYEVDIKVQGRYLILKNIAYVAKNRKIQRGTLVSELNLAGDVTVEPRDHVVMFAGDMPCDRQGCELTQIHNSGDRRDLGGGLIINHTFSSKPQGGYPDYYEKMNTYASIISGPAQSIDPAVTSRTFAVLEAQEEDSVFEYVDTGTNRAGIGAVTEKLCVGSVAIVGLGGTGSYILDFVAKTPVSEIHLFDGDMFGQHNAFRSPGAPSLETLRTKPMKAAYFGNKYSEMRRNILAHGFVDESNVECLRQMDFVFVAVDSGPCRKLVAEKLAEFGVPFIDVGMGIHEVNGSLLGLVRVTTCTDQSRDQVLSSLLHFVGDVDDEYSRNIQIAELNALNAALAVIRWKKHLGFYVDIEKEHTSIYTINGNHIGKEGQA